MVQETSEEKLFIKSRQIAWQMPAIENYDFRISRSEIQPKFMCLFRLSFLTTLDMYKAYFKSHHTRRFILSVRSYCVCMTYGFVTKCFLIFIVDEVKNFAANNIIQVARVSHVLRSMQRVSHRLEICVSGERRLLQDQVWLDIEANVQL